MRWSGWAGADLGGLSAKDFGLSLPAARAYMLTIPGAAMTAPWYVQRCKGGVAAANAGNMREIIRLVAGPGKSKADLRAIRATIHGDRQVDDFVAFRKLLGT